MENKGGILQLLTYLKEHPEYYSYLNQPAAVALNSCNRPFDLKRGFHVRHIKDYYHYN